MSIVGVLAWRSALQDSIPINVPDFRKEKVRQKYENDNWSPNPDLPSENRPPSSILGNIEPNESAKDLAKTIWNNQGFVADF